MSSCSIASSWPTSPTGLRMACSSCSGSSRRPPFTGKGTEIMRRLIFIAVACFALGACGRESLYAELDEQQANEMLAVLVRAGIDANKVRTDKSWSIELG